MSPVQGESIEKGHGEVVRCNEVSARQPVTENTAHCSRSDRLQARYSPSLALRARESFPSAGLIMGGAKTGGNDHAGKVTTVDWPGVYGERRCPGSVRKWRTHGQSEPS